MEVLARAGDADKSQGNTTKAASPDWSDFYSLWLSQHGTPEGKEAQLKVFCDSLRGNLV